jgi:hypothetical protein
MVVSGIRSVKMKVTTSQSVQVVLYVRFPISNNLANLFATHANFGSFFVYRTMEGSKWSTEKVSKLADGNGGVSNLRESGGAYRLHLD